MNPTTFPTIGRLAPSPTGAQHVGNARTYVLAWLASRTKNGKVLLRMEDIDSPRVKKGAEIEAVQDLRWLGLDWDGEILVQSTRINQYQTALKELALKELIYPCTCTRNDVLRAASAPHEDGQEAVYPGTCAHRFAGDASGLSDKNYCWRFRCPKKEPDFIDQFKGPIIGHEKQLANDFVVWRMAGDHSLSQSWPAYQLAVVVDDAFQKVTEVVRGDDLVSSTPKQILLYQSLNLNPPAFIHLPLVVGEDGRRLAKRHGDTRLSALRGQGVKPESLLGLIAYSCGWMDKPTPVTLRELTSLFDLNKIPNKPFVLTKDLLKGIGYES